MSLHWGRWPWRVVDSQRIDDSVYVYVVLFFLRVLVLRDKAGGYEPMVTLCMDQNKASDVILHWGRGSYRRLFWREKKKKNIGLL